MRFRAIILGSGKTATGIVVPDAVVESLGTGKRPPIRVTINGYTYRSTIAVMGGKFMVGVSAENRKGAGVAEGDKVDIDIELDNEVREVAVPKDLSKALSLVPVAKQFFEGLSYSNKRRHVMAIEQAKTDETRQRRIDKAVSMFKQGLV